MTAALGSLAFLPRGSAWTRGYPNAAVCVSLCAVAIVLALLTDSASAWETVTLAIAAIACATLAGWVVTEVLLQLALGVQINVAGVLPATGWVGLVERFGFTLSLVLGFPEVAALLIGVKAIGTYTASRNDNNRAAAARVLGTLSSITWALLSVAVYLIVVRNAST